MGNARWSSVDWDHHARATGSRSRDDIFTQRGMHAELDPARIRYRESRDSEANPNSTPIIIGVDETGSMGVLAEIIIKQGLGTIMKAIYERKPVSDPHIMCMALGDATCDVAPLQVTQFEAGVDPLTRQVMEFYLEGNGGGNNGESYPLAWLFTMAKTKCDAIKRGRKGYLFTIGDECPLVSIRRAEVKRFLGLDVQSDVDAKLLVDQLQLDWHVFHLIVKPVPTQPVVRTWRRLLGERAIEVNDIERLAEGIVAVMQLVEGASADDVAASWGGKAHGVVADVVGQLTGV